MRDPLEIQHGFWESAISPSEQGNNGPCRFSPMCTPSQTEYSAHETPSNHLILSSLWFS